MRIGQKIITENLNHLSLTKPRKSYFPLKNRMDGRTGYASKKIYNLQTYKLTYVTCEMIFGV